MGQNGRRSKCAFLLLNYLRYRDSISNQIMTYTDCNRLLMLIKSHLKIRIYTLCRSFQAYESIYIINH